MCKFSIPSPRDRLALHINAIVQTLEITKAKALKLLVTPRPLRTDGDITTYLRSLLLHLLNVTPVRLVLRLVHAPTLVLVQGLEERAPLLRERLHNLLL